MLLFENLCIFLWCKQEGKPHKYGQEENSRKSTRCCEIYIFVGPEFSLGLTSSSFKFREKYMIEYDNYTGEQEFKGAKPEEELVPNMPPSYGRYDLKGAMGLGFAFMDRF